MQSSLCFFWHCMLIKVLAFADSPLLPPENMALLFVVLTMQRSAGWVLIMMRSLNIYASTCAHRRIWARSQLSYSQEGQPTLSIFFHQVVVSAFSFAPCQLYSPVFIPHCRNKAYNTSLFRFFTEKNRTDKPHAFHPKASYTH